MTVTAEVLLDDLPASEGVLVGAFAGDELRGVAELRRVESLNKSLAFLMVHSNAPGGENLAFRLYDPATDQEIDVEETLAFTADAVRGTLTEPIILRPAGLTGPGTGALPQAFALGQNYPNPPRGTTTIAFALPVDEHVTLQVFDVAGRLIHTLMDEPQSAGYRTYELDTTNYRNGIYFYRMTAGSFVKANRFVIAR
jgi:hypothetical protein